MSIETQIKLAEKSGGRVVLHILTLLRDGHLSSHFKGILRELKRA